MHFARWFGNRASVFVKMDTWLCAFLLRVAPQCTNVPDPTPGDTKGGTIPQGPTFYIPSTPIPTRNTVVSADNVDWYLMSALQATHFHMYWTCLGASSPSGLNSVCLSQTREFTCLCSLNMRSHLPRFYHNDTLLYCILSFISLADTTCKLPEEGVLMLHTLNKFGTLWKWPW